MGLVNLAFQFGIWSLGVEVNFGKTRQKLLSSQQFFLLATSEDSLCSHDVVAGGRSSMRTGDFLLSMV
jgi:hypothetical protein